MNLSAVIKWTDNVETPMRALEKVGAAVEVSTAKVARLAKSLSLDTGIKSAHEYASALDKMGGVANLTASQKDKINKVMNEAIAKYAQLGKTAPAALHDIANATQSTSSWTDGLREKFSKLGPTILATFSVAAVTSALKSYADFTGQISDLSAKTGIGAESLQRLKYAAEQNGATLDQVTGAVLKLGSNLAGGNTSAVGALDALGLSLKTVRGMEPDKAFTTIADAIAKIPNPMDRSKLAMDLFGKSGAELLPMMRGNLSETAAAADRLGLVMSEEAVAAGDEFGDTMDTLIKVGQAVIAQMLTPMIPALTTVGLWLGDNIPKAISGARAAFDWLIKKGLEAQVGFQEFVLKIVELGAKVPWLGEKLGATKDTIASLRAGVQIAKDTVAAFDQQTRATGETAAKTGGSLRTLNLDYDSNAEAAKKSTKALIDLEASLERVRYAHFRLGESAVVASQNVAGFKMRISEVVALSTDYSKTLMSWQIRTDGLGRSIEVNLTPSLKGIGGALHQAELRAAAMGDETVTLGQTLKDALTGIPDLVKAAFTGGGGILGALKAVSVEISDVLMKRLTVAGQQLVGVGVAGATALGSKAGGMGATIAGVASTIGGAALAATAWGASMTAASAAGGAAAIGASVALAGATMGIGAAAVGVYKLWKNWKDHKEMVQENNKTLMEFQQSILATLTAEQVAASGGVEWQATVIGVRDAYLATGRTAEQALVDVKAMWDSTTVSTEATKAAMDRVNQAFIEQKQAAEDARVLAETIATVRDQYASVENRLRGVYTLSPDVQAALTLAFNAQTPQDYKLAIDDINSALDAQHADARALDSAMQKYGLTWKDLGKEAKAARLAELTGDIRKEFDLLQKAGVDVNLVVKKMGPEINEIVKEAKKSGVEVPESFRKVIQAAIDAGALFGEDKKKITDMKDAGIVFGTTMEDTMKSAATNMSLAIERLIEVIEKRLGPAIKNIPDGEFKIRANYTPPKDIPDFDFDTAHTGALVTAHGLSRFHTGAVSVPRFHLGTDEVPAILQVGEMVLSRRQASVLGRSGFDALRNGQMPGGGGAVINVTVHANGAHFNSLASRQDLADRTGTAVMERLRRETRLN